MHTPLRRSVKGLLVQGLTDRTIHHQSKRDPGRSAPQHEIPLLIDIGLADADSYAAKQAKGSVSEAFIAE
jgi:hypothetical protein